MLLITVIIQEMDDNVKDKFIINYLCFATFIKACIKMFFSHFSSESFLMLITILTDPKIKLWSQKWQVRKW